MSLIDSYFPIFIQIGIALVLALVLVSLSRLMGPYRPNKVKESVYESGMDPVGTARDRFSVKFFMVAMFFILFDIEIVFMYPWAVSYNHLSSTMGLFPLIEMFIFVVILLVGYLYIWKKGGLDWD